MLHWALRKIAHTMRDSGRLNVLVMLILHANERNRCYPSQALLAAETGWSEKSVNDAVSWLEEHGAIERVPYDKRHGANELALPPRQTVYQLTGSITIDGVSYPYLYIPEREQSRNGYRIKPVVATASEGETVATKTLATTDEGSTIFKDKTERERESTTENAKAEPHPVAIEETSTADNTPFTLLPRIVTDVTPYVTGMVRDMLEEHGEETVMRAMRASIAEGAYSLTYVERKLDGWRKSPKPAVRDAHIPDNVKPLVDAYRDANGMIAYDPNAYDRERLQQLHDAGVTPERLAAYIRDTQAQDWWQGGNVPLKRVVEHINTWQPSGAGTKTVRVLQFETEAEYEAYLQSKERNDHAIA